MRSVILALAGFALSSCIAHADTFYDYTGNYFDYFGTNGTSVYTPSERVTGYIETAAPLAPDLSFAMITPEAFSFNDGVQTLDSTNATFSSFIFTDGSGGISQFFITVIGSNFHSLEMVNELGIGDYDIAQYGSSIAEGDPGSSYTRRSAAAVTPEPSSLALLSTGILGVVGLARKRLTYLR